MQGHELDNCFDRIEEQKPVEGSFLPRLDVGQHTVIVTGYRGKDSKQNLGTILEADFEVETSTVHAKGEARGWPWFPNQTGWAGAYESDRVKGFMTAVDTSVGFPKRTTKETGRDLALDTLRGVRIHVTVTPSIDRKTGRQRTDKNGKPCNESHFSAIPGQTMPEIQARSAAIPKRVPPPPQGTQGQQYQNAPHPSQMPQQAYPAQYAQQPMQPQYASQPAPQGVPMQPQYAPQPAPQGVPMQPQYAPQPQQPYPPQGVPMQPQPQYAPQPAPAQPQYQTAPYPPPGVPQAAQPQPAPQGYPQPGQMPGVLQGLR